VQVIQEVALGRNVVFYCGKHLMNLKTMVVAADFKRLPYSKVDADVAVAHHWRSYLDYHDALQEFIRRKDEGEPVSNFGLTLSGVLMVPALGLEATRPEDKIYGLYGVCKRLGFELPAPDYKKSLAQVYTEAARAILLYEPGLELLSAACESPGWEKGIPSWVPDFSGCIRRWSPSNPPHMTLYTRKTPLVSGRSQCQYEFMMDGQALSVRGRRVGVLSAVGQPWRTDASTNMLGDSQVQTGQYISSLVDCIGSWLDVVQGRADHPEGKVAMQMLAQVLAQDSAQPLSKAQFEALIRYLSVLVERSRSEGVARHKSLIAPEDSPLAYIQIGDYLVSKGMQVALGHLSTIPWKTVFRTVDGHLGGGNHTLQEGDIVAVFRGCAFAATLRPWGEGWYRYVGPAYVLGIMGGEFWDVRSAGEEDESFVLL
jgi:hypothetical protein